MALSSPFTRVFLGVASSESSGDSLDLYNDNGNVLITCSEARKHGNKYDFGEGVREAEAVRWFCLAGPGRCSRKQCALAWSRYENSNLSRRKASLSSV